MRGSNAQRAIALAIGICIILAAVALPLVVGPVATQLRDMNNATLQFPINTKLGYLTFNLNTTIAGSAVPPVDPTSAQSHVTIIRNVKGVNRLSAGAVSTPLDNASETVLHYNEVH